MWRWARETWAKRLPPPSTHPATQEAKTKQNKTKRHRKKDTVARNRAQAGEPRQCQEASHARNVRVKNERADDSEKQVWREGNPEGNQAGGGGAKGAKDAH